MTHIFSIYFVLFIAILVTLLFLGVMPKGKQQRGRGVIRKIFGTLVFAGVLSLMFASIFYQPLDGFALIPNLLKEGLPLFGILVALSFLLLRDSENPLREFLLMVPFTLIVSAAFWAGVELGLNGWLDRAEPRHHTVLVLKTRNTKFSLPMKNRGMTRIYHAHVKSWRRGRETEVIQVGLVDLRQITRCTILEVATKPGWFGHEWVVSFGNARPRVRSALVSRDIATKDPETYCLLSAAGMNRLDVVQWFVEDGGDPNVKDRRGRTALHLAALYGQPEVAHYLLGVGADVDRKTKRGRTPLHHAVQKGHDDVVQILLGAGAAPEITTNAGWTALQRAADVGDARIVKFLLEKGAEVDARGGRGVTPLYVAAQKGRLEVVKVLLEKGADVNARNKGWTALRVAEARKHNRIATLLRQHGGRK